MDHKPTEAIERDRIQKNGGTIYQTHSTISGSATARVALGFNEEAQEYSERIVMLSNGLEGIIGPYRVMPGRLSVSRTFGDIEAKRPEFGGMAGVVVCDPDIFHLGVQEMEACDFIVLGSDGIFDKLSSEQIIDIGRKAAFEYLEANLRVQGHPLSIH